MSFDDLERSVFFKPCDEIHALERRDDFHAIRERVERTLRAFAEPSRRFVRVQRDDEAVAEFAGLLKVSDMTFVKQVEDAVREDVFFRPLIARASCAGRLDLALKLAR